MIHLRAPEQDDLDLMYRIENDPALWQYGGPQQPVSRYTLSRYIELCSTDYFHDEQLRLTICEGDTAVGFLDLSPISTLHQRAEVGIVLDSRYQRRGLATEALAALVRYVRAHMPLRQLYALVPEPNQPSHALFRRAGFTPVATLPQWVTIGREGVDAMLYQYIL